MTTTTNTNTTINTLRLLIKLLKEADCDGNGGGDGDFDGVLDTHDVTFLCKPKHMDMFFISTTKSPVIIEC